MNPLQHDIPQKIVNNLDFDTLWRMKPEKRGYISHNKSALEAHRFYKSYGNTPDLNPSNFSYMFSDGNVQTFDSVPPVFSELIDYLNTLCCDNNNSNSNSNSNKYNQVVVNWYENGDDYCPRHKDCLDNMSDNATVSIVNIVENGYDAPLTEIRDLVFWPGNSKPKVIFKCKHGVCITFGDVALRKWTHGVPKSKEKVARRISISFRSYK